MRIFTLNREGAAGAMRGGAITVVGQGARYVIQLVSVVVLARLLSPEDFGLIAMVAVVLALGDLLRDFGLPTAALRAPTLSQPQASNLFWLNGALGATVGALVALSAPAVVWVFGEPMLGVLTPVLASTLLLGGVQAQIQVQLARQMSWMALALTDLLSPIVGLLCAVLAAQAGWGPWSLVVQAIATSATLLASRAIAARWVPSLPSRATSVREIVGLGGHVGGAQLLSYAASNVDSLVIGNQYGASSLGFYSRAFQLVAVPVTGLLGPLTNVVLPLAARAKAAGIDSCRSMIRVQVVTSAAVSGLLAVVWAAADPLIPLALGDKWAPSIDLFRILAVGSAVQVLSNVSYWTFLSEGRGRDLLRYNLVTKPMVIVLVCLGGMFGAVGVAVGYSLGLILSWPINLVWLKRSVQQPIRPFLCSGMTVIGVAAAAAACGVVVGHAFQAQGDVTETVWRVVAATVSYAALLAITPAGQQFYREVYTFARRRR